MIEATLFYSVSAVASASAAGVVLFTKTTINSALWLVVTMLALAVLFIMLHAEFIGVLQVMVYAGAIVVLFLFVIMLLNLRGGNMGAETQPVLKVLGAAVVIAATLKLASVLRGAPREWAQIPEDFGQVKPIGLALYTDYVLAFELAGVLLLAGIVGAVILAKKTLD